MDKKELNTNDEQQNNININNNEVKTEENLGGGVSPKKSGKNSIKKPLAIASILGVAAAGVVGGILVSNNGSNSGDTGNNPPNNYVNFIDFTKNDNGIYSTEVENAIENLDFSKCIQVSENCTWQLFSDAEATQPIDDIVIALVQGYNTFYVKVSDEYGNSNIYALQIRRQNQSFLVTFNTFGGTNIETQSIEEGKHVTKPKDPVKDGYEFTGWNFDFNTPITEDTIITANYNLINYSISYNLNGGANNGENPNVYTVIDNITLLSATKNGYTFEGWYADSKFKTKVTEITSGSIGNITLYAKYEVVNNKITYELDGGINDTNNPENYTVETETITLRIPTKEGYLFKGWYNDNLFTNEITEIEKGTTGDLTLYAKWEEISYTVTFNTMGGSAVAPQTVKYNKTAEQPTAPTKNGYTFISWYTEESYINEWDFSTVVTENRTLYAKFNLIAYNIIYNLNEGTNNANNPENYTVTTETIVLKAPTREGYIFGGWYTDNLFANRITEIPKGSYSDIVIYAKWEEISYTVTFNTMGGSAVSSQTVKNNKPAEQPTAPTKNGYTFIAWYTEEGYTNEWDFSTIVTENVTLYAKYNLVNYTINYYLDGGINNNENPTEYTIETNTIKLKEPTKEGFAFGGWYTEESYTNERTEISKGTYSNLNLYAKWESDGEVEEDATFIYTRDGVITGLRDGVNSQILLIPSEINGVKITSIADHAFADNTQLAAVRISEGIKTIGSYAFSNCTSLTQVVFDGTETIEYAAFKGCSELNNISFKPMLKEARIWRNGLGDVTVKLKDDEAFQEFFIAEFAREDDYMATRIVFTYEDAST